MACKEASTCRRVCSPETGALLNDDMVGGWLDMAVEEGNVQQLYPKGAWYCWLESLEMSAGSLERPATPWLAVRKTEPGQL